MKKIGKKIIRRSTRLITTWLRHPAQAWKWYDRHYGWRWRIGNGLAALLILVGIALPIASDFQTATRYSLSTSTRSLVGQTNTKLLSQLTYDGSRQLYQFNKAAISNSSLPAKLQKASVGTPASKDSSTYALDVPQTFSKGVTYHDVNSQLSFSLVPNFKAMDGKTVDGHLVFPLDGGNQAIYTLKGNGLKEDIVVPTVTSDTMRFSYTLNLPDTLEAKVIPNSNGAIGIYSADPSLFGDISYGSDADQALVEKARQSAEKNYLVFGLPAPVIKTTDGSSAGSALAQFELDGNQLSVVATGLKSATGPLTIDPSVVVTSTSDFQTNANNEGNIDFSTSGQINRAGLSGGSISAGWTSGTTTAIAMWQQAVVAANGYVYELGGYDSGIISRSYVQYAPINSDGSLGAWHYTHNSTDDGTTFVSGFTTSRAGLAATIYNGYIYIFGGTTNGTTYLKDVQYAPLNSNGTVGTWNTLTSFTTAVSALGASAANGYMYIYGGTTNGSASSNAVQYAPINADGTLGSWSSATSMTGTGRYAFGSAAYNGYLYVIGGRDASTLYASVQYAPINSDGSLGSWVTGTSFTTTRYNNGGFAYNGYLYEMGSATALTDVQYAPIYANGSVGSWNTTSTFSGKQTPGVFGYGGYIYNVGGATSGGVPSTATQYAKVDISGTPQSWATDSTHTLSSARALVCAVAYNGYLYAIGGSTNDSISNNVTTVQYSAISSSGALSAWSTATAMPKNRGSTGCTASNGYLYVLGGYAATGTGAGTADGAVLYNSINSNGSLGASWTTNSHSPASDLNAGYTPISGGLFAYGSYIYSVGGDSSSGTNNRIGVYYAPINSDGSVGTWVAGQTLDNNYTGVAFARIGKYLYGIGGLNGSNNSASVEYSTINSDGSVAVWNSTTSLPGTISYAHATDVNGCIYVVGGETSGGTSVKTTYYACPGTTGTIASWSTGTNLVTATTDMGIASYNGMIYGVGGYTTTDTASIANVGINNGGSSTLGSSNTTTAFSIARSGHFAFAYKGYLYVIGGFNASGNPTTSTQYAPINSDGTLGTWANTTALPTALGNIAGIAYNGYVYVMGGYATPPNGTTTAQYAPINSDGTLGTWANTTALPTGVQLARATARNGYMYILGGYTGSVDINNVYYASVGSNGTLGSWTATTALPSARDGFGLAVSNGYMYVLGGEDTAAQIYNDVASAPINGNGTLGSWTYTTSFATPRANAAAVIANGSLYLIGGDDTNSVGYTDVQYAPLLANGTIGSWNSTTSLSTYSASGQGVVYYKGNLYIAGTLSSPFVSSSASGTVSYAGLNSIGRVATYSKLIDLGTAVNVTAISATASPSDNVSLTYRAGSGTSFGSLSSASSISSTAVCTGGTLSTRYLLVTITLDDSGGSTFSDTTSSAANVSDFTVTYNLVHPAPNIRLRGGKTLQSGNLSALDTCYP